MSAKTIKCLDWEEFLGKHWYPLDMLLKLYYESKYNIVLYCIPVRICFFDLTSWIYMVDNKYKAEFSLSAEWNQRISLQNTFGHVPI